MSPAPHDLHQSAHNSVRRIGADEFDALAARAQAAGLLVRRASLLGCTEKRDLLTRLAGALQCPVEFGVNWDALSDTLRDLSWLPASGGFALLLDHAESLHTHSPADFQTLLDILREAASAWRMRDMPWFAFVSED